MQTITSPPRAKGRRDVPIIKSTGYGFFCGGDPRKFSPGGDSTEEELENHRRACAAWDAGERTSRADCEHGPGYVVTSCQFGLGSYEVEEECPWLEWAQFRLGRARVSLFWRLPEPVRRLARWVLP